MSGNPYSTEFSTSGYMCHNVWQEGYKAGARSRDAEVAKNNEYSRKLYQELCQKVAEVSAQTEEIDALKAKMCILAAEVDADRAERDQTDWKAIANHLLQRCTADEVDSLLESYRMNK